MTILDRLLGRTRATRREALGFWLCVSPWVLGLLIFQLAPIVASLILGFTKYNISRPPTWVGLANYERAFTKDLVFWQSLKVTFNYALISVPLLLVLGMGLALLLNVQIPGVSVWRTLYYLPSILAGVAVASVWTYVYEPHFGILNTLLAVIGVKGPSWMFNKQWVLPCLILISVWGVGGTMIIYLSALQGIPTALYESAIIDGAGILARFRNITLPMMTPVILFNIITGIISSFRAFTTAYVMTRGGPQNASMFYSLYLYFTAFRDVRMGYASMLGWILFLIILVLTLLVLKSSAGWVYYEGDVK